MSSKPTIAEMIEQILSNYTDEVKALYHTDAMFRSCVISMARGTNPHEVIQTFVLCHQKMSKQLEDIINLFPAKTFIKIDK